MTAFDRLGREIAREQDALRARATHRADVRANLDGLEIAQRAPDFARKMWLAGGAGVVSALAAAAWLLFVHQPAQPPLSAVAVQTGIPVGAGAWLEAPGAEPYALRFSDGTRVEIAPHSRARLVDVDENGAHLLLESGRARLQVTHRPHARWQVSAGPFAVHVIGTRFDVQWNPEQDKFALDLTQGAVDVAGCAFEQGYHMRAGQRLEASCKDGRFDVSDVTGAPRSEHDSAIRPGHVQAAPAPRTEPAPAAPAPVVAPVAEVTRAATPKPARNARVRRTAPRAPADASASADKLALRALPSDFEVKCASAGLEELAALADAAHYARDQEREGYAWRLLRKRFPGTPRAALAAFALGRLEFDAHGSYPKAAEWFGTYLKEQPTGSLVREARGRLMEATLRAGDTRGARALGAAYLHDYPSGPHADLARSLEQTAP